MGFTTKIYQSVFANRPDTTTLILQHALRHCMYEIRFHGRGGQGGRMAAEALALAAFLEDKYAVSFPFFGAERRGAPVRAFTRIDDKKIRVKTQIYEPDCVVVLDEKLVESEDVIEGLKEDGIVVINTRKKPEEIELSRSVRCATVDATSIALDKLGRAITNTAILGAVAKATGIVGIEAVEKAIIEKFGERLGKEMGEKNAEVARIAYEKTTVGTAKGGKVFEKNDKEESGVKEKEKLIVIMTPGNFTDVKQVLEYFGKMLNIRLNLEETVEPRFINGRTGKVLLNEKEIGTLGEIHPSILKAWHLKMPLACLEIDLDELLIFDYPK